MLGVTPAQVTLLCHSGHGHLPFAIAQGLSHFYLLPFLRSAGGHCVQNRQVCPCKSLISKCVCNENEERIIEQAGAFLKGTTHNACGQERTRKDFSEAVSLRSESAHSCALACSIMQACLIHEVLLHSCPHGRANCRFGAVSACLCRGHATVDAPFVPPRALSA